MTLGEVEDSSAQYHPVPRDDHQERNYIVLPIYIPAIDRCKCRRILISAATFLFLATAIYILWPSIPDPSIVRIRLGRFHIETVPHVSLDIMLELTVKVRNPALYSLSYSLLTASIGYRGKQLGFVTSDQGHIRARGSSYVNATLELDGVEVLSDTIRLIEDFVGGSIPFDTVTQIEGELGLFFFHLPLKAKVSCEVDVNTHDQTIVRQDCYPE